MGKVEIIELNNMNVGDVAKRLHGTKPVFVAYLADWCGHCRDFKPHWEMVELGKMAIFKRGPFGGSLKKEIFVDEGYLVYEQYHAINDDYTKNRYFITSEKFEEMRETSQNLQHLRVSHERVGERLNGLLIVGRTTSDSLLYNLRHQHARF